MATARARLVPIVLLALGGHFASARHRNDRGWRLPPWQVQNLQRRQQNQAQRYRSKQLARTEQVGRNHSSQPWPHSARWASLPGDDIHLTTSAQAAASSPQMALGMPTGPALSGESKDLLWIARPQYVSLFDHRLNGVRIVSWVTRNADLGTADRSAGLARDLRRITAFTTP
jgi:hypothetical protein